MDKSKEQTGKKTVWQRLHEGETWVDEILKSLSFRRWPTKGLQLFYEEVLVKQGSSYQIACANGHVFDQTNRNPLFTSGVLDLVPRSELEPVCARMAEARTYGMPILNRLTGELRKLASAELGSR